MMIFIGLEVIWKISVKIRDNIPIVINILNWLIEITKVFKYALTSWQALITANGVLIIITVAVRKSTPMTNYPSNRQVLVKETRLQQLI